MTLSSGASPSQCQRGKRDAYDFDFILANPPFNTSDWGGHRLRQDTRWKYGLPPEGNANYAWLQHIAHHLSPTGTGGIVLANGSLTSNQSGEGGIRRRMVDSDLIDCVVSLPSQLFYSTQIAVSLWLIANDKKPKDWRDRQNSILMIDARSMGHMVDRTRRELSKDEVSLISSTFHSWQGRPRSNVYHDIPGFCHSCSLPEVVKHEYALVPGRYVGFQPINLDEETLHSLRSEFLGTIDEVLEFANDLELSVLSVRSLLNG